MNAIAIPSALLIVTDLFC